jgi:ATP-binding cassette subfamily A (ABC1) protein 3
VSAERRRLQASAEGEYDSISIRGLQKVYASRFGAPPKRAVRDLWFGVPEGQCFGFLGINGAGKTTTLRILTGDEAPSDGTAYMNGFDILTQAKECRKVIGYCPQVYMQIIDWNRHSVRSITNYMITCVLIV